ncbi:unnamed protein product (mitochondrion) [Plasmodiophora brassicae]|uniref:Transmembrane protein n=1 Tax=Plasmodiophora brassicae TaxID=37360 RepID=A0A0G4J5Q2_PLABS|nr:hypothetical protein PBRA_002656 [Plasmodiophora brassicae]SPQ94813.1 unnamed protein product [Plasmodiophora brassicae]
MPRRRVWLIFLVVVAQILVSVLARADVVSPSFRMSTRSKSSRRPGGRPLSKSLLKHEILRIRREASRARPQSNFDVDAFVQQQIMQPRQPDDPSNGTESERVNPRESHNNLVTRLGANLEAIQTAISPPLSSVADVPPALLRFTPSGKAPPAAPSASAKPMLSETVPDGIADFAHAKSSTDPSCTHDGTAGDIAQQPGASVRERGARQIKRVRISTADGYSGDKRGDFNASGNTSSPTAPSPLKTGDIAITPPRIRRTPDRGLLYQEDLYKVTPMAPRPIRRAISRMGYEHIDTSLSGRSPSRSSTPHPSSRVSGIRSSPTDRKSTWLSLVSPARVAGLLTAAVVPPMVVNTVFRSTTEPASETSLTPVAGILAGSALVGAKPWRWIKKRTWHIPWRTTMHAIPTLFPQRSSSWDSFDISVMTSVSVLAATACVVLYIYAQSSSSRLAIRGVPFEAGPFSFDVL